MCCCTCCLKHLSLFYLRYFFRPLELRLIISPPGSLPRPSPILEGCRFSMHCNHLALWSLPSPVSVPSMQDRVRHHLKALCKPLFLHFFLTGSGRLHTNRIRCHGFKRCWLWPPSHPPPAGTNTWERYLERTQGEPLGGSYSRLLRPLAVACQNRPQHTLVGIII